jgi:hypothetical protein
MQCSSCAAAALENPHFSRRGGGTFKAPPSVLGRVTARRRWDLKDN